MSKQVAKAVTILLPPAMVEELDRVRRRERRSRPDLMREALRRYMAAAMRRSVPPAEDATADEVEAVCVAEEEYARGKTVRLEDLQNELGLPTR